MRKTRAQAEYEWFHGLNTKPHSEPGPDVGEAFRAGWDAALAAAAASTGETS